MNFYWSQGFSTKQSARIHGTRNEAKSQNREWIGKIWAGMNWNGYVVTLHLHIGMFSWDVIIAMIRRVNDGVVCYIDPHSICGQSSVLDFQ